MYLKNQGFQKISLIQFGLLIKYSSQLFLGKIRPILNTKNYFETQNFEIFDKVVHNFGKSDKVII